MLREWQRRSLLLLTPAIILAFLLGCADKQTERPATSNAALRPASAHSSSSDLKFTAPPTWVVQTPSSSMRKAQYLLPRVAGDPEDAEMVVYYFQGQGGSVQANVDRWLGQFTKPDGTPASDSAKVSRKESHGIPLTIVDVSGTYVASMGPMQAEAKPKQNFRLLAAVAEPSSGPWFFKLTGPAKTVGKWEASFHTFLETVQQ